MSLLDEVRSRSAFALIGYGVMSERVHLLSFSFELDGLAGRTHKVAQNGHVGLSEPLHAIDR